MKILQIEIRADGAHISGYVNATEKKSKPVITPHGKVVEEIEPGAFTQALNRAGNITVTVDHDDAHIYASTDDGSLSLYEDDIGLHADVLITDPKLIDLAKTGRIKGWSFGMFNVKDVLKQRADALPLRKINALDIDHITLVVNKSPSYSATSIEVRADKEWDIETRSISTKVQITQPAFFDNSSFRQRADLYKK